MNCVYNFSPVYKGMLIIGGYFLKLIILANTFARSLYNPPTKIMVLNSSKSSISFLDINTKNVMSNLLSKESNS